jgi:hypothetical protein
MASPDEAPTFVHHDVGNLYTIAHLFPKAGRCGIYVLEFANGERYVGQSLDLVRRFGDHRRRVGDIASIQFLQCRRESLDELELQTIRQQRANGRTLRNIVHGTGPIGDSDLDPLVTRSDQQSWLNSAEPDPVSDAGRTIDETQRAAHIERFERLQRRISFPLVAEILHHYVPTCVLRPAETERTFWALSAMPDSGRRRTSRRLCTLSINKMETLVLFEGWDDGDSGYYFGGWVNMSVRILTETLGDVAELTRRQPALHTGVTTHEAAGGDALAVEFDGVTGYKAIWNVPGIVDAARALNLMLMRKGPTLQWRWHSAGGLELQDRH